MNSETLFYSSKQRLELIKVWFSSKKLIFGHHLQAEGIQQTLRKAISDVTNHFYSFRSFPRVIANNTSFSGSEYLYFEVRLKKQSCSHHVGAN